MTGLRLIVGLGNPGADHSRTRHNAGFWFIDALAESLGARFGMESKLYGESAKTLIAGQPVWLLKPATFMNASGKSVSAVTKRPGSRIKREKAPANVMSAKELPRCGTPMNTTRPICLFDWKSSERLTM